MQYGKSFLSKLVLVAVFAIGTMTNAWAHKVISAAYPDGELIEGEIGFSSGDMAANIPIVITDPDGNKLGEATTDEEGLFSFTATQKVDHIFRADLSAGHIAIFTVLADELPDDLAGGEPKPSVASTVSNASVASNSAEPVKVAVFASENSNLVVIDQAGLEKLISKVTKETRALRKDLVQYKEERRMQDILGGIGYILGIFGIASFLLGRRKSAKAT